MSPELVQELRLDLATARAKVGELEEALAEQDERVRQLSALRSAQEHELDEQLRSRDRLLEEMEREVKDKAQRVG